MSNENENGLQKTLHDLSKESSQKLKLPESYTNSKQLPFKKHSPLFAPVSAYCQMGWLRTAGWLRHFCITFIDLLIKRKNIWNTLFWLYLYFEEIFVTLSSTKKSILRWTPFQKYLFIIFWNMYFNCAKKYYFILKTHDSLLKSGYPGWSPMPYCY